MNIKNINLFNTIIANIDYFICRWRICGVVSNKENQIKEIKNARGVFRVFSFVVTDKEGNSIRVSAFGEQADKFHSLIQNDQVLTIESLLKLLTSLSQKSM